MSSHDPTESVRPILDYILRHAQRDERPYLEVDVLGHTFLGLLDSGASRTFLGRRGWDIVKGFNIKLDTSKRVVCTVANGQAATGIGVVELPIRVKEKMKMVEVIVVPELPHSLILGLDFWVLLGIVPDLRHNEWHFSEDPSTISCIQTDQMTVLTPFEAKCLNEVVEEAKRRMGENLGCTNRVEHKIITSSPPIRQRPYRVSPVMQKIIDDEIEEMLKMGIIEPSKSPWAAPVVLVQKKNTGKYRFCVDYRKLNLVTERDSYPLPVVSETLDKLKDAKYLSSLDIKSAYWQVPIEEASKPLTAFICRRGLFQFRRMPFGLHNAPATWQRLIDNILGADLEPNVFVYLDDVVIISQDFEEHLRILKVVFERLREANITVSWDKCQFCRPEMRYLGYVVDRRGLRVDPDKVRAMLDLPRPRNPTEVRRILGSFSWYRRFVPEFSSIVTPITALTMKNHKFVWTPDCEQAFRKIKELLVTAPILSCPDYSREFVIQTDASGYGIGAVLSQPHPEGERVICYLSRSLTKQERNYTTTERECLALVWAIEKLRPYIELVPFTVITDHYSLKWLQSLKDPSGRLARWSVKLQQHNFKVIHRSGKNLVVPDMLSRAVPAVDLVDEVKEIPVGTGDRWYNKMTSKILESPLKFLNWRYSDQKLYKYVRQDYPQLYNSEDCWKLVVPKADRGTIIESAHDPPTAGHMGVYKTFSRLAEKYYWPKMRQDVASYVRKCSTCAAHKGDPQGTRDQMVSHAKPSRPWEMISTDLIGPLPRSYKGNTMILVVTDYLSKFSLVFPLRSASTKTIISRIEEQVFMIFGVPRVILCDNGPQYRSNEFRKFADGYDCRIQFNAHYHPRANPTERQNKTIKTLLAIYVQDNHRRWDEQIHKLACAIRTSTQETTKVSPFFVNFGRNMCLSGKDYSNVSFGDEQTTQTSRNEGFKRLFVDVKKRLEVAGQKNVERYNLRKRSEEYLVGQKVWRKNYVLSNAANYFSSKLAPKYVGPFMIHRRLSPWTYELKDMDNKIMVGSWHSKDLKPAQ
jgi:hypothetical protein